MSLSVHLLVAVLKRRVVLTQFPVLESHVRHPFFGLESASMCDFSWRARKVIERCHYYVRYYMSDIKYMLE